MRRRLLLLTRNALLGLALLLFIALCGLVELGMTNHYTARAGIITSNLVASASITAGTNTSTVFVSPQTHTINPLTFSLYHTLTNTLATNYLEVTFDGGATWAIVASKVTATNAQVETWTPTLTLSASNRVRILCPSNQTYTVQGNWIQ